MNESYDEIYNGPRLQGPLNVGSLGDVGSSTDEAFAEGRRLFSDGKLPRHVTAIGKKRPKSWLAALRKGYAWQKARSQ